MMTSIYSEYSVIPYVRLVHSLRLLFGDTLSRRLWDDFCKPSIECKCSASGEFSKSLILGEIQKF